MTRHLHGRIGLAPVAALLLLGGMIMPASTSLADKDIGPRGACDSIAKGTPGWQACLGEAAKLTDAELFYAGYWLAKSGHYAEALGYLNRARIYLSLEKEDKALEDANKAIELAPNESDGYYRRADIYNQMGKEAEAKADEAKAEQLDSR